MTFSIVARDARNRRPRRRRPVEVPGGRRGRAVGAGRRRRGRDAGVRERRLRPRRAGPARRAGPTAPGGARPAGRGRRAARPSGRPGSSTRTGRGARTPGRECFAWAGGRTGDGFAAQGNILAGAGGRRRPGGHVHRRRRAVPRAPGRAASPRQMRPAAIAAAASPRRCSSCATGGGYGGGNDRWIDLRVDDHDDPIGELGRILELQRLYFDRPTPEELVPLDGGTGGGDPRLPRGCRRRPRRLDGHALRADVRQRAAPPSARPVGRAEADRPRSATLVPCPTAGTPGWHQALIDWMGVENLEERTAAPGWIDPRVVEFMRARAARR